MVLRLEETMFLGEGYWKRCYRHPANKDQCVKVVYRKGGEHEILRELSYRELLGKRKVDTRVLPRYFGTVETNLGTGYIYETVLDSDGSVSKPMGHFVKNEELLDANFAMLVSAIKKLKLDLWQNGIVTMGFNMNNIFIQNNRGQFEGRLVDNIGSASILPVEYYISYFARARLKRRWKRFTQKILADYPDDTRARFVEQIQ